VLPPAWQAKYGRPGGIKIRGPSLNSKLAFQGFDEGRFSRSARPERNGGEVKMITLKDPTAVRAVLTSEHFEMYSVASQYRELGRRTGFNFDAIIQLLDFLPTFIDGEAHLRARKIMARRIALSKKSQENTATKTIQSLFEKLFIPQQDVEFVSQFAQPLWREVSSSIVESNDEMSDFVDRIPSLFRPDLSIRERIRINEKLANFLDADGLNAEEQLANLGLAVLGAGPFIGSLVLSVYQIIVQNSGKRSNEISWPETFPASSLHFIDRVCTRNTQIVNHEFHAGTRIRCCIHDASYSTEYNKSSLFGYAMHTCLGKGISEFSWKMLIQNLAQLDAILVPLELQMASPTETEPYSMPATARIGLRSMPQTLG
jgi:hypothetical protein